MRKDTIPTEYDVQTNLAEWLRLQHPTVLFRSDMGGVWLPPGLAWKVKRLQDGRSWLDFFLPEPRGDYHGLFLEIKKDRAAAFTQQGELRKDAHLEAQQAMIDALNRRGYLARWGLGFEDSKAIIEGYLRLEKGVK